MHQCSYCSTTFTTIYQLNRHQRTAKYCLALQNTPVEDYKCTYCNKSYTRQDSMLRHQKICPNVIDDSQQSQNDGTLQVQISDLMALITKLVERPATNVNNNTHNNRVMNLPPITDEEIADHLQHLTIDFIHDGAKGYADFAGSYPFKNRLLCTDKARKKLRYKDSDGELIDDANGLKLTQRFFQAIAPRNEELINAEYRALHQEVQKIDDEGTAYTSNLTDLLTKATHLQELLVKCQQAAKGEENELTKGFVNHLSKML
jgi:hypothetical protein